jgi:hypothetical protein
MSKRELGWLLAGVIGGIIFGGQIRNLPLVNKIPRA